MSDDLIKRQDAMEVLHRIFDAMPLDSDRWLIQDIRSKIADIPSADRPQGEWVYTDNPSRLNDEWKCSRCGNISFVKTNFCDRCGARMKGADDE